jgi:hypothetical protein
MKKLGFEKRGIFFLILFQNYAFLLFKYLNRWFSIQKIKKIASHAFLIWIE